MVTRTRTGIDNFMGGSIILYFLRPIFYLGTFFRGRGYCLLLNQGDWMAFNELLYIDGVG